MPEDINLSLSDTGQLADFIALRFYGVATYKDVSSDDKPELRIFLSDFLDVVRDVENVKKNIDSDTLTISQRKMLDKLLEDPKIAADFIQDYVQTIDVKATNVDNDNVALQGYSLQYLLEYYKAKLEQDEVAKNAKIDPFNIIDDKLKAMGPEFTGYFDFLDTDKKIREIMLRDGKFREDSGPAITLPYQCRIGGSTFFIPPTSIAVHQGFKTGSLTGGVIRQPNSAKINLGHSETSISMTLFFPNHETIWGFNGETGKDLDIFNWDPQPIIDKSAQEIADQIQIKKNVVSDRVIDSYLSSLRGLITQFKYSPILPVKNEYLNRTFDIDAVALMGMTVSTVPDFPFVVVVNLELAKYNYSPFMPMIHNFDQAIHWGKFRQYMGRAAARLDSKVNQGFLIEKADTTQMVDFVYQSNQTSKTITHYEGDLLPKFDKTQDIKDGRNFDFYFPVSDPARIFAPDTTDFRQPGEDLVVTKDDWDFILKSIGLDLVDAPTFNFFEFDRAYKSSKTRNEAKVLQQWLGANKRAWSYMTPSKMNQFIEDQITQGKKDGYVNDSNEDEVRAKYKTEWFFTVYETVINDDPSLKSIQAARINYAQYTIKEWQVPMEKLIMDWTQCIVTGVSVSLANNFAKLQVQLQDEPTYQHIGGGDSTIQVSMVVIGEDNLIRFRRLFEHIGGLARIEKAHGVLGFLGIKNVLTSLCGIKYVLPLDFETETMPNYPHVYNVRMTFIDFDVMQQEREKISSEQQKELIETFGKRNPFLRLKQSWGAFNAYPDFPLDVRDENGRVIGHLDPDWYFRAFSTTNNDADIFTWKFDPKVTRLIQAISNLTQDLAAGSDLEDERRLQKEIDDLENQLKGLIAEGAQIPNYWDIVNGKLERTNQDPNSENASMPEPEMTIYLGSYSENKDEATVLSFFEGGYVAVGTENVKTQKRQYSLGMSYFKEDRASVNLKDIQTVDGITPLAEYQHEYIAGAETPNAQYQSIMQDYAYRNIRGRMLRAFPTYMLWLIDEGGRFAGIKLFDNFYGINSVIDFSVVQSAKPLEDTLVLRLSNIYNKLTTPFRDEIITEDDPLYNTSLGQWIIVSQNRDRNILSGLTDKVIELNNIRLKPGVRIHLRAGYSGNPNALQTIFNGVITEVEPGDIMTIIAQSDAVELSGMVNTVNSKGSSGKLDGGINTGFWMSEPRDLMVRLLTIGSSNFKEWFAWGSKGVFFSDSRFGIRHFGTIQYESMNDGESTSVAKMLGRIGQALSSTADTSGFNGILGPLGNYSQDIASIVSSATIGSDLNLNSSLLQIGQMLWINSFAKRDYEIFKRNIYPGNGSGIAQFMGGDQIDAGIAISSAITYYEDSNSGQKTPQLKLIKGTTVNSAAPTATKAQQTILDNKSIKNQELTKQVISAIDAADNVTDQEVVDIMSKANINAQEVILDTSQEMGGNGLIDSLLTPFEWAWDGLNLVNDYVDEFLDEIPLGGIAGTTVKFLIKGALPGGQILQTVDGINTFTGLMGGVGRMLSGGNPLGSLLGLSSAMPDDDLAGFDEVSFRAQTYMKTVWDLFEVCAALLPNYIVAVRPFEDRSTVFYGKPHWLYTSGVIPVTTGVPKNDKLKPLLDEADKIQEELTARAANSEVTGAQRAMTVVDKAKELKDIMSFTSGDKFDPYSVTGDSTLGINISTQKDIDAIISELETKGDQVNAIEAIGNLDVNQLTRLPVDELRKIFSDYYPSKELDPSKVSNIQKNLQDKINEYITNHYSGQQLGGIFDVFTIGDSKTENGNGIKLFTDTDNEIDFRNTVADYANSISSPESKKAFLDLANNDPITFAYQFGWKFDTVPVWINPETGYGVDKIGDAARRVYDDDFATHISDSRGIKDANDIWETLRKKEDGVKEKSRDIYDRFYPLPELQAKYEDIWQLFLRFMWQDPYNRAWVVVVVSKVRKDGVGDGIFGPTDIFGWSDAIPIIGDSSNHWNFDKVLNIAWKEFITATDVEVDSNTNIVTSRRTTSTMQANQQAGSDAGNALSGAISDVTDWFDKNIGQVIGLITNTVTGFIASIRMSLAQLGNALSMTGQFQKQANIMNASLNDSIYYQLGDGPTDLLRLVDNPFTREYGEPVIEIREPFQRIHYVSSFDNILNNGIKENLNGVATVVTALSDGKHPVTVHFDKGVSPERQVEKTVDTGLLWDNAVGNGLFGFLQPLLHPIEAMRAVSKIATGSSDELSARRVALYHLKQSLQGIYSGELLVMGDADIRPHDLVYMADAYERMYGMFEAEQVIHHFTPDTGFVTAIVPNALVSINDPVRYSLLAYAWSKMSNYNIRDDMRAYLGITTDRAIASASKDLSSEDIYRSFSTQIHGSVQYTQGSTAIVRDIGAIFASGGVKALTPADVIANQIATIDMGLALTTAGATVAGGIAGTVINPGVGTVAGAVGGWAVSDLIWQGWQWIKENLLDQHGAYIQYLNKDGQAMDAGLSYYQGVAVGTNHTLKLLPSVFGINSGRVNYKENGHFRITTNDLLGALGWSEVETTSLYKDTSIFVNQINTEILKISGRAPEPVNNEHYIVVKARVISNDGENINGQRYLGVEDGDTLNVQIIDGGGSLAVGSVQSIRLAVVNAYELQYHDNKDTPVNETDFSLDNDLGKMAYNYLVNKFSVISNRTIAIRMDKRNLKSYNRYIGVIFHNVPMSISPSERLNALVDYAKQYPPIQFDEYLPDGRPYTLNWELIMSGYGNVDMRESLWETTWRNSATTIKNS